jgi:S-adenosylmethionine hydrolase
MPSSIITLTTDFGPKDPYVAEIKAVILSINPDARIVDVTHEVEKFNTRMAAYVLACAAPYFPNGTVHVAVVDPGVGTKRQAVLIQTRRGFFVGPDNGVLALAAGNQSIERVFSIKNRKLMLPRISNTFHGRDVFAPVAAHLSNRTRPTEIGPEIHKILTPRFVRTARRKNTLVGEVLYVDGFGNIITNFEKKELDLINIKETVDIKFKKIRLRLKLCKAYEEVEEQKALAIIGSHNFLEVSVNQGNAARKFKVKTGDEIALVSNRS